MANRDENKPTVTNDRPKQRSMRKRYNSHIVYRPDSNMRRPLKLFMTMWRDLLGSRELAWQLTKRDISAQYRQSFLGIAWAVIPPIVAAAGFTFATNSYVLNIGETDLPYPAYVMFSTALWQTFTESVTLPMQKVVQAKTMLTKISFPREALILSAVGQVLFNFAWKLILIVGMFLWFRMPTSASVLLAPVALVHLIVFGTAIGTFLAPMGALYSDFAKGIPLIMSALMFFTPVVYPIPSSEGAFGLVVNLNPITPLLVTIRELATTGIVSDVSGFWSSSILAFCGILVAWLVYKLSMPYTIERMSS